MWTAIKDVFETLQLTVEVAAENPFRLVAAGDRELDSYHSGKRAAWFADRARTIVTQAAAAVIASVTADDVERWTGSRYEAMARSDWETNKYLVAGQVRCQIEALFLRRKYVGLFDLAHPGRAGPEQRTIYSAASGEVAAAPAHPTTPDISADNQRLAPRTSPRSAAGGGGAGLDELLSSVERDAPELPNQLQAGVAAVAIKYIFSTGVTWAVVVRSTDPLVLQVEPNWRMKRVLLAEAQGEERERARTVVARALKALVFNLTEERLRDLGLVSGTMPDPASADGELLLAGLRPRLRDELEGVLARLGPAGLIALARRDSGSAGETWRAKVEAELDEDDGDGDWGEPDGEKSLASIIAEQRSFIARTAGRNRPT